MSDSTGKFVWYEWMGDNLERAVGFYRHVIGWDVADSGMGGFPYKIGSVGKHGVAGFLTKPDEAKQAPSCWTGYIWVADVDAAAEKLVAAGGKTWKGPMDIPHVGRFAIVSDAQGAPFALFRDGGGSPTPPPPGTPGLPGWRELRAADGEKAMQWYAGQFGWKQVEQLDMGPMGAFRLFEGAGEQGGIMTQPPQSPGPHWLYYFLVDAADAAAARATEKGGKVLHGPNEVPGGMWTVQVSDPEGAPFGIVAGKR